MASEYSLKASVLVGLGVDAQPIDVVSGKFKFNV
jgi:hypothetical protein